MGKPVCASDAWLVILRNLLGIEIAHINGHWLNRSVLFLELLLLLVVKLVQVFHLVLESMHEIVDVRLFLLAWVASFLLKVRNYNVERMRLQSRDGRGPPSSNNGVSSRWKILARGERTLSLLFLKCRNSTRSKRCVACRAGFRGDSV